MQTVERLWNISASVVPDDTKGEEWERAVQDLMTVVISSIRRGPF